MEATFSINFCHQQFSLSRTKLEPYDPTTRTSTTTATLPDSDLQLLKSVEEEFIQSGPTHLLEAVYCDPCKAKVMDYR